MIAAACTMVAVVALGAALRPRPAPRRLATVARRFPATVPWRHAIRPARRRKRPSAVGAGDVAVWCEGLARVVRSGSTLGTAVRTTEPPSGCSTYVDGVVLALDRGSRLADALGGTTPSPHLDLAVTVLRACALNGGPPAEPLDRAAATLRGRAVDAAERQTQSAQARLSAVVMTILPIAMLGLLLATSSTTRSAASTPMGSIAIGVGAALNLGGWRWMRRIIAGVAS